VSIHKKNELREPDHKKKEYEESEKQPEATVGSTVSIKFGRKWFEGEILSDGMLPSIKYMYNYLCI